VAPRRATGAPSVRTQPREPVTRLRAATVEVEMNATNVPGRPPDIAALWHMPSAAVIPPNVPTVLVLVTNTTFGRSVAPSTVLPVESDIEPPRPSPSESKPTRPQPIIAMMTTPPRTSSSVPADRDRPC
jgi:hypothetical protein